MEKVLVVYYSRTGNTRKVAEALKERLNCDIEEIKSLKSYDGALGWIRAGKEASQKVHAKIEPAIKNPADYDLVIFGTPVWAWNISSPLRAYLAMNRGKFKRIAAFCTMGSDEGRSFEEIGEICQKTLDKKAMFLDKDIQAGKIEIKNLL